MSHKPIISQPSTQCRRPRPNTQVEIPWCPYSLSWSPAPPPPYSHYKHSPRSTQMQTTTFKYPTLNFHAVVTACLRPRSPPYPHNKHSLSSIHSAEDQNQVPKLNIGSPITACLWSTVTPLPQLQAFPQLNTVQRTTIKYLH